MKPRQVQRSVCVTRHPAPSRVPWIRGQGLGCPLVPAPCPSVAWFPTAETCHPDSLHTARHAARTKAPQPRCPLPAQATGPPHPARQDSAPCGPSGARAGLTASMGHGAGCPAPARGSLGPERWPAASARGSLVGTGHLSHPPQGAGSSQEVSNRCPSCPVGGPGAPSPAPETSGPPELQPPHCLRGWAESTPHPGLGGARVERLPAPCRPCRRHMRSTHLLVSDLNKQCV